MAAGGRQCPGRAHRSSVPAGAHAAWAYLAVLTPIIWGTTYYLTTEFLPPDRPWLAATVRSLPTGLVLIIGSRRPRGQWWWRFAVLSLLYSSAFMPLLFVAAYRLPGGVAAVINSIAPIIVVLLAVPLLKARVRGLDLIGGNLQPAVCRRNLTGATHHVRHRRPCRT